MATSDAGRLRGQVARSRWGERDQIGRLNLMTEASRQAILSRLDPSRTFDLGVEYRVGMPSWTKWGETTYQIWMTHTPSGTAVDDRNDQGEAMNRRIGYSGDAIAMYSHCGTHLDTLNHFGYGEEIFNGYRAAEHLGSRHWDICGAEQIPPIVARGVLLDVARHRGVDVLAPGEQLGAADLAAVARAQEVEVREGDVVAIRTGRMLRWQQPGEYMLDTPGINVDGAGWLVEERGAMVVGADTLTLEHTPSAVPSNYEPVHLYLLAEQGAPIIEVMDLEALAAARVYEFAFFGAPLKLVGATGSPLRPIAMPLRKA